MGSGIAQVAAQSGFNTIQYDISEAMLEKSRNNITANLDWLAGKQKISTNERDAILKRLQFSSDIRDCKADLVIEAIAEQLNAKAALFNELLEINLPSTIYATNTSSISITAIQEQTTAPSRIAGLHFFNPAPVMKLVEIVKGKHSSNEIITGLEQVCRQMNKIFVTCKDSPGFIVNRVARPYYLEALRLIESGVAGFEDIDEIMEATGFKMGPFRLMDLIGIDINYSVSDIVWNALGKPARLTPSSIQKQKTAEGKLGKKTGEGFYKY